MLKQQKYQELFIHLEKWEKEDPENPELFIAYFNYYLARNYASGIFIDTEKKGPGPVLEIKDPKTGEGVGSINESVSYNQEDVIKSLEYLDKSLVYAPDRLDIYFGKIHVLNEIGSYKNAGETLANAINRAGINKSKWLWSNNKPVNDGKNFFINNVQDYYVVWFNSKTEIGLNYVKLCSEMQIEIFPDNIIAYNNLATYYSINKQYNDALEYFLKAQQIDPDDCIVLINIGLIYLKLDNPKSAKKYFEQVTAIGNEKEKKYAQSIIDKL